MGSESWGGRAARLALVFTVGLMAMTLGGLVSAQEQRPEVRLEVEGGIDGWVEPGWPMTLTVRIEADLLLVGELLVVQGEELLRVEVEVPANGARTYEVVTAPPAGPGAILLRVIPNSADDDEPVASAFFRPRMAGDEILVGVVGLPRLDQVLGEVRSAISGVPITPVTVEGAEELLEKGEFHQLSYLVLDRPRPLPSATVSWLQAGGRLITTSTAFETMQLEAVFWGSFPGVAPRIGWHGVGEGEVLVVHNLSGLDSQSWARMLRPTSLSVGQQVAFEEGPSSSLTQAALSVENETPSYPWLPLVVVVYAVVVGPVNLWMLRRRRRLEWAWFTIPALGLVGVVAFWIVGASGVNQTFWSHVTVQVAGPDPQVRSGLVAATSGARALELSFDADWEVFPENLTRAVSWDTQPTITRTGSYQYELPSLGWLSVNAFRRDEPVDMGIGVSEEGVELTNLSSVPVVAWGVHAYPKTAIALGMAPGDTGVVSWEQVLVADSRWTFGDAFWVLDALWEGGNPNQNWLNAIGSLGDLARTSGMVDVPFYVFAVTEEPIDGVEVDGGEQAVPGLKLTLFPVPVDLMGERGWAFGRPMWQDAASRGLGFDGNAEQWILSYRLPRSVTSPRLMRGGLDPGFAGFPPVPARTNESVPTNGEEESQGWEAWDWAVWQFVPVDVDRELDPRRFVAPSGEVLLRISEAERMPAPLVGVLVWGDLP